MRKSRKRTEKAASTLLWPFINKVLVDRFHSGTYRAYLVAMTVPQVVHFHLRMMPVMMPVPMLFLSVSSSVNLLSLSKFGRFQPSDEILVNFKCQAIEEKHIEESANPNHHEAPTDVCKWLLIKTAPSGASAAMGKRIRIDAKGRTNLLWDERMMMKE